MESAPLTKSNAGVAVVGVGYWGPNLLRNLVANTRCNVTTVVDLSRERREYVRRLYPGIRVTDSVDSVLQDPDIDAVVIATPVATHFDLAIEMLKAGKHILVEKPLATTVSEVKEIGALARYNDLVAMVGHTFLFSPPVRYVKNADRLGRPWRRPVHLQPTIEPWSHSIRCGCLVEFCAARYQHYPVLAQ